MKADPPLGLGGNAGRRPSALARHDRPSGTGRRDAAFPLRPAAPLHGGAGGWHEDTPRDPRPPRRLTSAAGATAAGVIAGRAREQEAAGPRTSLARSPPNDLGDAMASPAGPDVPLQLAGRPMPARTQLPQPPAASAGRSAPRDGGRRGASRPRGASASREGGRREPALGRSWRHPGAACLTGGSGRRPGRRSRRRPGSGGRRRTGGGGRRPSGGPRRGRRRTLAARRCRRGR